MAFPRPAGTESLSTVLRNAAGVQLLSPSLHKQVFGEASSSPLDPKAIQISLEHLHRNKLAQTESKALPTTEFTLPRLQGSSIQEHFYNLGLAHSSPYFDLAKQFAEDNLPPQPDAWVRASGWIRYNQDGSYDTVEYPPDDAMSFDVETMYKIHPFAVMACAASKDNWYAWISPWLLGESEDPQQLIPFASPKPRVLVGHNVGFDRARIQEEYNLERTQNRFLDTMSLHVAITGLSSHQRAPWMKYRKIKAERMKAAAEAGLESSDIPSTASKIIRWEDVSSMSSLEHVAKLHCNVDLDKSVRDYFSTEDKQEILDNLDDLITYCASDVDVTHKVFKAVLPAFLENCPNPVTFAGVLAMGNSFLPVDKTWPEFIERAERLYRELTEQVESELFKLADQARRLMFTYGKDGVPEWEKDPWLSQMDWSPKKARAFIASPIGSVQPSEVQAEGTSSSEAAENINETEDVDDTSARDLQSETAAVERATAVLEQEASEEGIAPAVASGEDEHVADLASADDESVPKWLESLRTSRSRGISVQSASRVVPLLLQMSLHGYPLQHDTEHGWYCVIPEKEPKPTRYAFPADLDNGITGFKPFKTTTRSLLSTKMTKLWDEGILSSPESVAKGAIDVGLSSTEPYEGYEEVEEKILALAEKIALTPKHDREKDPWLSQLDWTGAADIPVARTHTKASGTPALQEAISGAGGLSAGPVEKSSKKSKKVSVPAEDDVPIDQNAIIWPKWFWDIYKPKAGEAKPNLTLRSRLAPLLLRIRWSNYPIFHSRQHGWVYRIPRRKIKDDQERDESGQMPVIGGTKPRPQEAKNGKSKSKGKGKPDQDIPQQDLFMHDDKKHFYYKLPHKDGSEANVGTPLARPFVPSFEDGTLTSEFEAARAALEMNAKCSYWISARERIMNQMVVWQNNRHGKATEAQTNSTHNQGMILPQVVTMGTVTRRAVESTWLAASNAKKNRLGSELKAMVRAPPGYAIVGADVDSEELWICSVMGDAQFGFHGATAIGWMTLEGTKSAGTDLHSKTASIMGISRDQAKIFNYSRLYGAGVKHAVQLLLQGNPKLSKEDATLSAKTLYSATKGERVHKPRPPFNRKMWYGGTESHVFNKLEDVATAADPRTPALGCGITAALAKKNLPATEQSKAGEDFMPSRINWVVQSSGVDYLHLLIVSMEYLIKRVRRTLTRSKGLASD